MHYGKGGSSFSDSSEASPVRLKIANLFYLIYFVVFGILCFALYNSGEKWLGKIIKTDHTAPRSVGCACVFRTTCPLAIWFTIHSLLTVCNKNFENSWQYIIHSRFLYLHAIIGIGLWVGFWFCPDPFFDKFYMYFAMAASGIYLVLQILFLIDFFMTINQKLLELEKMWVVWLITIILTAGALVAFGVSYYIFVPSECGTNNIFISVNLVLCILLWLASAFIPHGSILTSSLVCAYIAYLTVAGMMTQAHCNRITEGKQGIGFSIAAAIFTLVWAGYSAFSSSYQWKNCSCTEEEQIFSLSFFHALYALASVYITMVVTHWGQIESTDHVQWATDRGVVSRWVNFAASWVTVVLYAWTLIAPLVCKNREFE